MIRLLLLTSMLLIPLAGLAQEAYISKGTVGIEGQFDLAWTERPLEIAPIDDDSPVLVRIATVTGGQKDTDTEGKLVYDIRWIALLPGEHDLSKLFRHNENDPAINLPPMKIQVSSLLGDDHEGTLHQIPGPLSPIIGFPRWVMWVIAAGWLLLPLSIMSLIRWLRKPPPPPAPPAPAPTLAELLRPLVNAALSGQLDDEAKARLERLLLAYWRDDLDLGSFRHGEAIQKLRADAEAGLLLVTVEQWLHSGREEAVSAKQLDELLAPYARSPAAEADPQEQAATEENR